jgi:GNAT superfamily N-acetyltransferase
MNKIQCIDGNYDKTLFYSKMGRFFAEERYIRQMPYLRNEADRVWFLIENNNRVITFSSLRIMDFYILFTTEYVEAGYRRRGLFKALTDVRFEYCRELDMPVHTATNIEFIKDYYIKRGFEVYRTTKNYWFLCSERRDAAHEIEQRSRTQGLQCGA